MFFCGHESVRQRQECCASVMIHLKVRSALLVYLPIAESSEAAGEV